MKSLDVQKSVDVLSKSGIEAVLADAKSICHEREFEAAYELAKMSFFNKENIAHNLSSEILLFLACQKHVRAAIERVGARNGKKSVLAVFDGSKINFEKFWLERIDEDFTGCENKELLEKIEKMALSRI